MPLKRKGYGEGGCVVDEDGRMIRLATTMRNLATELRRRETPVEKILWKELRKKKLYGLKFYRQVAIDRFVADFYCPSKGVIVEIDGKIHLGKDQMEHDKMRSKFLLNRNFRIIRITNEDVIKRLDDSLQKIACFCGIRD
jgi:very-short-patch-repair endonuclease